jgi:hypothetical protein
VKLGITLLICTGLFWNAGRATAAETATGTISGSVTVAGTLENVAFARVVILGTRIGATTTEDGAFRFSDLAPGIYALQVMAIGHQKKAGVTATVVAGRDTELKIELEPWGPSPAAAAHATVGADVSMTARDFECRIVPARAFKVGERPAFKVRIRNRSWRTPWLIKSVDGSNDGRYPQVAIEIVGPPDGFVVPPALRCGNMNGLSEADFVRLAPGGAFDPFDNGWLPYGIQFGRFAKAGKYVATFRYSTNQSQVKKWLGLPPPSALGEELSQRFRHIPLVDLTASVEFEVRE